MARVPPHVPEVEIDPALLIELDTTGSFTSPIWRPEPAVALPPPPRLPSVPSLPSRPSLPPLPSPPSLPSLPSLPPPSWVPALPPLPRAPRAASGSTLPPARALPSEATRHDLLPPRVRETEAPHRTLLDAARPSLAPATWSVPPSKPRPGMSKPARAAGVGIVAGVTLFAGAWLVATPSTASAPARALITVTDSRGIAERSVHVLVDGLLRCETAPCSVELEPGSHQVDVVNLQGDERAGRSLSVGKGERATLHFALAGVGKQPGVTAAPPAARAAAASPEEPISVTSLAQEPLDEGPPAPVRPATSPVAPRPASGALLNLNSIPISNVVLDGRPIGSTPLVGVSVSPGTHSVTFVHPEHGRRGASIDVGFGERKAVVVRFKRSRAAEE